MIPTLRSHAELRAHLVASGVPDPGPIGKSKDPEPEPWPPEMAALLERFAALTPEQIPAGTRLGQHSGSAVVVSPETFIASLRAEIARGAGGPRARAGAQAQDIKAACETAERNT